MFAERTRGCSGSGNGNVLVLFFSLSLHIIAAPNWNLRAFSWSVRDVQCVCVQWTVRSIQHKRNTQKTHIKCCTLPVNVHCTHTHTHYPPFCQWTKQKCCIYLFTEEPSYLVFVRKPKAIRRIHQSAHKKRNPMNLMQCSNAFSFRLFDFFSSLFYLFFFFVLCYILLALRREHMWESLVHSVASCIFCIFLIQ